MRAEVPGYLTNAAIQLDGRELRPFADGENFVHD